MHRLLLLLALAAAPLFSHAIEEPRDEVIRPFDNVELRQYAPYVVAEVVPDVTAKEAGSQAFPILAGYIFGKNKGDKNLAMTAPLTPAAVPDCMRVQFVLPEGVTLESDPEPLDWERTASMLPLQHVVV